MMGWMGRHAGIAVVGGTALLAFPLGALAGYYDPPSPHAGRGGGGAAREVEVRGNPFSGGFAFDPDHVRVTVGATVRWTNTDSTAHHSVTEDHGIFDLSGSFGPPGRMGFGPGESREHRFAAGTFSYHCRVHPEAMRGVVAATLKLSLVRRQARGGAGKARIRVIWARQPLPNGQAFDVQRRVGTGPWRTVRSATRALRAEFGGARGGTLSFRSRIRLTGGPAGASGYSPAAKIRLR
jgi:plastocyanin